MLATENVGGRKCWRPKMLAAENVGVQTLTIWAWQNLQSSDSFSVRLKSSPLRRCCLSSMKFSVRLKSSLSDGVVSPPCRPQVGSALRPAQLIWAASLPYCTGLLYRPTCPNVRAIQMFAAADISPFFWEFWPIFRGRLLSS
jgi:hypothetical protein